MKCPKCGFITDWDTLRCPCGYDSERQVKTKAKPVEDSKTEGPFCGVRTQPLSGVGTAIKVIWGICVLGFVACAVLCLLFLFFFATVGGAIGKNDGPHYAPFLLLIALPVGGGLLLIGGIWFSLSRLSKYTPPDTR